jgi:hypothetical protein
MSSNLKTERKGSSVPPTHAPRPQGLSWRGCAETYVINFLTLLITIHLLRYLIFYTGSYNLFQVYRSSETGIKDETLHLAYAMIITLGIHIKLCVLHYQIFPVVIFWRISRSIYLTRKLDQFQKRLQIRAICIRPLACAHSYVSRYSSHPFQFP